MLLKQILASYKIAKNYQFLSLCIPKFKFNQLPKNFPRNNVKYPTKEQLFPEDKRQEVDNVEFMKKDFFHISYIQELQEQQKRAAYYSIKVNNTVYHVFDASKIALGRMCQLISFFIRGKHKPTYRQSRSDLGDKCVVVNAGDILLTGKKARKKNIIYHTGFVGNLKIIPYSKFLLEKPEQLVFWLVWKQLPRNKQRYILLNNLKVYRQPQHDIPFLPNFVPAPPEYSFMKMYDPVKIITSKHSYIQYMPKPNEPLPEELKNMKVNLDEDIELPINSKRYLFKLTSHNKKVLQAWQKYYKHKKRYNVYKPKVPKKNKILDGPQIIKSQKKLEKIGITQYFETQKEIEDETLTKNVF